MSHVYLAEPIDFADDVSRRAGNRVHERLAAAGATVYSPRAAWHANGGPRAAVLTVNETALKSAALLFAVMSAPTVGVVAELEMARAAGIPAVTLITDPDLKQSLMLSRLSTGGLFDDTHAAVTRALELTAGQEPGNTLMVARLSDGAELPLPEQVHDGDIGMDLYVSEDTTVETAGWCNVPSGLRVAPPPHLWLLILGRSSAIQRRGLVVIPGVIDSGFRGPLYAVCHNISGAPVEIRRGERLAQLIPLPLTRLHSIEVADLPASERGQRGFGSTGG